ncbi:hypothetical protein [Aliiroseovarius sp. F20344]|uniref:hypothetical protein n=1 Tax=Aliiroseovarius sp. F20344 TaxID=2926414 RepID=UPI001FF14DF8|nr:hypothetical protein [Aliiroseovarius sp. F20344]MCK0141691.1 hypothetical protein [Aliiroseovarius sp. F20344]
MLLGTLMIVGLLLPVGYVETMCRGDAEPKAYTALIAPAHHRPESRTLMTYPEWDIVHAYEDYARVINTADPHDFSFFQSIGGFWSSLCSLTREASKHGHVDGETKQMVYVIGVSFTAELLLKAAYEETIGRLFTALRGAERAPLDDVSARQASAYAEFLQQVPWYKWDFQTDEEELKTAATGSLRDQERRFALGTEYGTKAAYADVIANAVAQVGEDALTLRMIVSGVNAAYFDRIRDVQVVGDHAEGLEIETPRYRALTHLLTKFAEDEIDFVEIAGNDDIMFTALSANTAEPGAIYSRARQGADDHRHLIVVKTVDLAARLRSLSDTGLILEHIHDY